MFGISGMELLVILLVAVVVLGPEKLQRFLRTATRVLSEFRRISTDLQRTMNAELVLQEHAEAQKKRLAEENAAGQDPGSPASGPDEADSPDKTVQQESGPQAVKSDETEAGATQSKSSPATNSTPEAATAQENNENPSMRWEHPFPVRDAQEEKQGQTAPPLTENMLTGAIESTPLAEKTPLPQAAAAIPCQQVKTEKISSAYAEALAGSPAQSGTSGGQHHE